MQITIGVQNASRELSLEVDTPLADVAKTVTKALADTDGVLDLTDSEGNRVLVPVRGLAYVHLGEDTQRVVGFA